MLGAILRDMPAPSHGSKQSDAVRKVRAQGVPYVKKKRRLNAPDERRGRSGGGETQSQPLAAAQHLQGQQEQPLRGRGGHEARRAAIAVVREVTSGEHGRGKGSKNDDMEFGQEMQL